MKEEIVTMEKITQVSEDREELKKKLSSIEQKFIDREDRYLKTVKLLLRIVQEMRIPVNSIMGFSEIMSEDGLSQEERKDFASNIAKSTCSLVNFLTDASDLLMLEGKMIDLDVFEVDLIDLIDQVVLIDEIPLKDEFHYNLISHCVGVGSSRLINTDELRLRQLFSTLVLQIAKMGEGNGSNISLGLSKEGDSLVGSVSIDHYIKLDDNEKKLLFNPYDRLDSWFTLESKATRLGFALCGLLADLLGATIWVCDKDNKQTSIKFTIVNHI